MAHTLSRVGYKHVCDPTVNIPFQAVVRAITQWKWMLLGVRDLIGLPLPHTVKTLTALWVKESLGFAVRVRKQWSQTQISRMRTFYFELMPIEVWKILHGLPVITASCWFEQITSLCSVTGNVHMHMYKGTWWDPHTHTQPWTKATALWRAVGESMLKLNLHGQTWSLTHQNWWCTQANEKAGCPFSPMWFQLEVFPSLQGSSQPSLEEGWHCPSKDL